MTTTVRSSRNPNFHYQVVSPFSQAGKSADNLAALPDLGENGHGVRMGVGGLNLHTVYRYGYDDRAKQGKWNYLYLEQNGVVN